MLIDCATCTARPVHCEDCVISVLLGGPPGETLAPVDFDPVEQIALVRLAAAGLVPPLRAVPAPEADTRGIA